jgi:nicotinamidase/pyrazinamidase
MKTVFFDVDTQLDFVYPAGALYVPGAENIVENLTKLTRYAAEKGYPIIATMDAHSEDDPEFKVWKPHCVVGTVGQQKCAGTIAPGQIVIEKQKLDCFSNPALRPLLKELAAERYVVYGVVSELCVRCAALGLLGTGARVEVVTDAIQTLDPAAERALIEELRRVGGLAVESHLVLAGG